RDLRHRTADLHVAGALRGFVVTDGDGVAVAERAIGIAPPAPHAPIRQQRAGVIRAGCDLSRRTGRSILSRADRPELARLALALHRARARRRHVLSRRTSRPLGALRRIVFRAVRLSGARDTRIGPVTVAKCRRLEDGLAAGASLAREQEQVAAQPGATEPSIEAIVHSGGLPAPGARRHEQRDWRPKIVRAP